MRVGLLAKCPLLLFDLFFKLECVKQISWKLPSTKFCENPSSVSAVSVRTHADGDVAKLKRIFLRDFLVNSHESYKTWTPIYSINSFSKLSLWSANLYLTEHIHSVTLDEAEVFRRLVWVPTQQMKWIILTHCNTQPAVRRAEPSMPLLLILAFCQ